MRTISWLNHLRSIWVFLLSVQGLVSCGNLTTESPSVLPTDSQSPQANTESKDSNDIPPSQSNTSRSESEKKSDPTAFFIASIKPLFDKNCVSCHSSSKSGSQGGGPLTIFSSTAMMSLLDSDSAIDTSLYLKITGRRTHTGGDTCVINAAVCAAVTQWHASVAEAGLISKPDGNKIEPDDSAIPQDSSGTNTGSSQTTFNGYGQITSITGLGKIYGFAANPNAPADIVDYAVFINGTFETGTQIARAAAQSPGNDRDLPGDHRFEYQVPETYRNGSKRTLTIYSVVAGVYHLLNEGQTDFYGYTQTAAGKSFYESQVQPALQTCAGSCHQGSMSYETNFGWLMTPAKHQGGTKTNNSHINNPATANGERHGGGNKCGSVNGGVCAKLQEWWQIEFGSL